MILAVHSPLIFLLNTTIYWINKCLMSNVQGKYLYEQDLRLQCCMRRAVKKHTKIEIYVHAPNGQSEQERERATEWNRRNWWKKRINERTSVQILPERNRNSRRARSGNLRTTRLLTSLYQMKLLHLWTCDDRCEIESNRAKDEARDWIVSGTCPNRIAWNYI